ncbi:hypothetical protein GT002_35935, partial [Streptomyces sp. SID4917]|nr:hypothetical protein [Streptomyces sp. SID4917]
PEPVHSAITTALAEDRPLAVPVGLQPPYTWSVAAGMDQLPHNGTAFVEELTRRPRLLLAGATDLAAIPATLAGPAGYIAALGSRATHAQRLRRLAGIPGL